ncbi:MAG: rod shape-determining protein RodA [Thermodesulfobacteriota bacterium]
MFDRRLIQYFDWGLLLLILLLGSIGIALIYSAVNAGDVNPLSNLYLKQMCWFGGGLVLMIGSFVFSYRRIEKWAPLIYGVCIALLVAVYFVGQNVGGATRWLDFGAFSLQPSEPAKLAVIIMLARYFAGHIRPTGMGIRELAPAAALVGLPFVLVLKQPDLGTAGLIGLIAATMTVFAKIRRRTFISLLITMAVVLPVGWFFLKDYQRTRILMLFFPESDPLGGGYHILQSKVAVGSGMLFGKGFMQGTQNILSFLPEQHTDFIFSVLSEEWGFAGSLMLLMLFVLLIAFGLNIAYACRDDFGSMLAVGITAMIFWQTVINIGMVMGLMPVVGMPLPLISYGGSSIITTLLGLGILMNVSMRRFIKA